MLFQFSCVKVYDHTSCDLNEDLLWNHFLYEHVLPFHFVVTFSIVHHETVFSAIFIRGMHWIYVFKYPRWIFHHLPSISFHLPRRIWCVNDPLLATLQYIIYVFCPKFAMVSNLAKLHSFRIFILLLKSFRKFVWRTAVSPPWSVQHFKMIWPTNIKF